ncbi:DiGeorge syndrome critical region protein 14 [Coemansia sp. RSA 1939]|nr:DiGeorge syndrome critical region protein 14 [Coemansia sp. RSA 1939]KAJ2614114.1 DiGeorge syndrome critical region protein 14 [Coemansia sp. RSA 1804]KAJ2694141.1 DiGeorge syndrome critical region protein 14 [Coemansia sp. RSA 1285]
MNERRVVKKAPASTTRDASSGKEEMTVLDESEFTFQVDRIVARDFFPDLKSLKAQGEELGLGSEDDVVAITTADASRQDDKERLDGGRDMSLDQFLATHTSEDNASFGRLVEAESEQRRRAHERMVGGSSSSKLTSSSTRKGLETWKYTARNALMFTPTAHVTTGDGNSSSSRSGAARILAHNTRLPDDFGSGDDQSNWDIESVDGDATPMINGYKLVREPTGSSSRAYGQGRTRGFKIGETPEREKLAQQLSKPRMAQMDAIKSKPARSGSSSGRQTAQRVAMLSPAAQRLLGGSGGNGSDSTPKARQGNNDHELRKAYNSPYVRRDSPTQRRL